MPRVLRGRTLILTVLASLVITAPAAAIALLDETPEGDPTTETTNGTAPGWETGEAGPLTYAFDAANGVLILDITGGNDDEPLAEGDMSEETTMCIPDPGGAVVDKAIVAAADETVPELPEGCLEINVKGPNGQINHGSVVSNTVHAFKELRAQLHGPLGHYVRELARTSLGKGTGDVDGAVTGGEEATATDAGTDGESDTKVKADKQNGPPEHSNAGRNGNDAGGNGNGNGNGNAGGNGNGNASGNGKNK